MRVLITGITGFAGEHLAEWVSRQKGVELYGVSRGGGRSGGAKARVLTADLCDAAAARKVLSQTQPDRVFHLAAQSSSFLSWQSPLETLNGNGASLFQLLEALRASGRDTRLVVAGSSEAYGEAGRGKIRETAPFNPVSPYGLSKAVQDLMAGQYRRAYGLYVVRARAFTHIGPRQREQFMVSGFARQVAMIERGMKRPVLDVGNLGTVRDFTDVRDVVRAYWLLAEKGDAGETYNICSGRGRSGRDVVKTLSRLSRKKFGVRVDASKMRPHDVKVSVGDASKLRRRTGWKPEIPFERSVADALDFWRQKVSLEGDRNE